MKNLSINALLVVIGLLLVMYISQPENLALAQAGAGETAPATTHSTVSLDVSLLDGNGFPYCRALFIEGAGDISIVDSGGVTIVYTVPAATLLPFRPAMVTTANTDASGIHCWR